MKRFWVVLLSLGLMMAFSTTVIAADAKFSGNYFLQGWYVKNHSLIDKNDSATTIGNRGSTAFYTQRLRVGMDFPVAKGLKLSTRFDALERKWMAARRTIPTSNGVTSTDNEAENIQFDVAYVTFGTAFGMFQVGSIAGVQEVEGPNWGITTSLGLGYNGEYVPVHGITWTLPLGQFTIAALAKRGTEDYGTHTYGDVGNGTDNDSDTYQLAGLYRWSTGNTGLAIGSVVSRTSNTPFTGTNTTGSRKTNIPYFNWWVVNKFGKLFIGNEFGCVPFGKYLKYNTPKSATLVDVDGDWGISDELQVELDLAPAKLGLMLIYSRGDDPNTIDKKEGGFRNVLDLDRRFNPCLILWNDDYMTWLGGGTVNSTQTGKLQGNAGSNGISSNVQNNHLIQLYGSYKMTPKLDFTASYTYATVDKKPTSDGKPVNATGSNQFISGKYGSELDVMMRYKIYDNLVYSIGAGYLWTGDYFKGTNASVKLANNYLITHKLMLTF